MNHYKLTLLTRLKEATLVSKLNKKRALILASLMREGKKAKWMRKWKLAMLIKTKNERTKLIGKHVKVMTEWNLQEKYYYQIIEVKKLNTGRKVYINKLKQKGL